MTPTKPDYIAILDQALAAAELAVKLIEHEEGTRGLDCGFAWIAFSGTEPFGRAVRSHPRVSKGYPTGYQVWDPGRHGGQSIHIKEAGAQAARAYLAEHGISVTVGSRYD